MGLSLKKKMGRGRLARFEMLEDRRMLSVVFDKPLDMTTPAHGHGSTTHVPYQKIAEDFFLSSPASVNQITFYGNFRGAPGDTGEFEIKFFQDWGGPGTNAFYTTSTGPIAGDYLGDDEGYDNFSWTVSMPTVDFPTSGPYWVSVTGTPEWNWQNSYSNGDEVAFVRYYDHQPWFAADPSPGRDTQAFQLADNPVDIVATDLYWDTPNGGIEFEYSVKDADLPQATTAALYWASGTDFGDVIGSPVYDTQIDVPKDDYGPYYVPTTVLGTPPPGSTHLLLVVDPDNLIEESDEPNAGDFGQNNVKALKLPDIVATSLNWNTSASTIDYTYEVKDADLPGAATGGLYWSKDDTFDASDTLAIAQPFDLGTQQDTYSDSVPVADLTNPPKDASYVLLVTDPDETVAESDESNNVSSLRVGWHTGVVQELKQYDSRWASELYDHSGNTIGQKGCALTCLSMGLYRAGITGWSYDGTTFNNRPDHLNTLMKSENGFSGQSVHWLNGTKAAAEAAGLQNKIVFDTAGWMSSSDTTLKNLLVNRGLPVIVRVPSNPDHFVLVTGVILDKFIISDPGGSGYRLDQYSSFSIRGSVKDPDDIGQLGIAVAGPVDGLNLLVTDTEGRRTGIDPDTGSVLAEIPESAYFVDAISNDITNEAAESTSQQVPIFRPQAGTYSIDVWSDEDTIFELDIASYATDGSEIGDIEITLPVSSGALSTFEIEYDSIPGGEVQVTQHVAMDIKPGSDTNPINLKSEGKLPVAVLTTPDFDATTIDTTQIQFGDPDLPGRVSPMKAKLEDVDGDGDTDLLMQFSISEIVQQEALSENSMGAELTANALLGGTPIAIRGSDSLVISGVRLDEGVLSVTGTDEKDHVFIQTVCHNQLLVFADFPGHDRVQRFDASEVESVQMFLFDGNDKASVGACIPTYSDGGPGNDFLSGGWDNDIIIGGDGRDIILGGFGNDIIIGGLGRDILMGSFGDDLLIGGTTAFDANDTALAKLMDEWASGRGYETRIQNIRGVDNAGFADRLNEDYFLVADATVFDDDSRDLMFGGWGMDWMFAGEQDRILGKRRSEVVDRLMMME